MLPLRKKINLHASAARFGNGVHPASMNSTFYFWERLSTTLEQETGISHFSWVRSNKSTIAYKHNELYVKRMPSYTNANF